MRKWDEGPSAEVEGMETLITEGLAKIKLTDPLRLANHADGAWEIWRSNNFSLDSLKSREISKQNRESI